ncbi:DNA-methyltransferase [Streptomyces sp. NPDC054933]
MVELHEKINSGRVVYTTRLGAQVCGDSLKALGELPEESVDLIVTSPPFPLLRKKEYGNESQEIYVDWLSEFAAAAKNVLKEHGSLVIDIGGAYQKGHPVRSLHQFRALIKFVDVLGYHLAEEFYWHNPARLPSPIEWVNKRKMRAKDSVNTVWWLSKSEFPKADVSKVRVPYSKSMQKLLEDPASYYRPKRRSSEHVIGDAFGKDNGGALPSNLLWMPNTESNGFYRRVCNDLKVDGHPARFPAALPEFFIQMLTDPDDVVMDIFSGSNTTGHTAEKLDRKWLSIELDTGYAAQSGIRFLEDFPPNQIADIYTQMLQGDSPVDLSLTQLF